MLTVATLAAEGYVEQERWHISEILNFVWREIDSGYWIARLTIYGLIFLIIITLAYALYAIDQGALWFLEVTLPFVGGCLATVLLIVPHELMHGLGFRLVGAKTIVYGADFTKLIFHASAPNHVLGRREMWFVALLPLVIITTVLALVLLMVSGVWWWVVCGMFLMHTQGCIGDLAIINFWERQDRPQDWVTYDEAETGDFVLLRKVTNNKGATLPE